MDGLELYICIILTIEFWYDYWYNTRENRIKRRKTSAKKDKIVEPTSLLSSSGKKDVALEPGQNQGTPENESIKNRMEMRKLSETSIEDRLHYEKRPETPKD